MRYSVISFLKLNVNRNFPRLMDRLCYNTVSFQALQIHPSVLIKSLLRE